MFFFLSDFCCVISDALHKKFLIFQTACSLFVLFSPVFSPGFLPAFLPSARFQSRFRLIFGIKKGCNLVSKRHYIATGRTLFIKRKLVLSRIPARRYVVYNKVPWLCVTASRRFCRQVFNYNERDFTCGLHRLPLLLYSFDTPKTFFQVFLKKISRIVYCFTKRLLNRSTIAPVFKV